MKLKQLFSNRFIVLLHDTCMVPVAWLLAFWLRYNLGSFPEQIWSMAVHTLLMVTAIQMSVALWVGCYRGMWRFASIRDLMRIVNAVVIGTLIILSCIFLTTRLVNMPRAVFPLYMLLLMCCWGGPRLGYRIMRDYFSRKKQFERVLIIGAGRAGEGLARDLLRDQQNRYKPVAFLDDDLKRRGKDIHGIRVVGQIAQLEKYAKRFEVTLVMIAIPSATTQQMQEIVASCERQQLSFRTLPSLADLAENRITINQLRNVEIEDLLGRDPVALDWQLIGKAIAGQAVLVTGGGGSIGSELCRQLANQQPRHLVIVEQCEYNLYQMTQELSQSFPNLHLTDILADVGDAKFMNKALNQHRPDLIFHAAAFKHVPILEDQLFAAVKNNIFTTRTIADLALQYRVKSFVMVSTDKAVNPTNIMGLSKRIAEMYCQNLNTRGDTKFITVRFGNVLGSTGSVVPLFRKQLEAGGPITVTHPEMQRYFMTIPEATSLILESSVIGEGGEIFVLDMGEPVRIAYLAEQMIRLAGKEPNKDVEIRYTGVRPGEKLFEELFHDSEDLNPTNHQKIFLAHARKVDWITLIKSFDKIEHAYRFDDGHTVLSIMRELVPEYIPQAIV